MLQQNKHSDHQLVPHKYILDNPFIMDGCQHSPQYQQPAHRHHKQSLRVQDLLDNGDKILIPCRQLPQVTG